MLCKYSCLLTIQDISIIFHHHWYIYSITIIPSPTNTFRRKVCVMVNWTLRNEYHVDILFTILCVYNVEFPTAWSGISFMRQNMNINRKRNEKWYQGKFIQMFLFWSIFRWSHCYWKMYLYSNSYLNFSEQNMMQWYNETWICILTRTKI